MLTKKIISLFTFGIFLILIGGTGKLYDWGQADILMGTGLVFELLAVLLYAYGKIKNK